MMKRMLRLSAVLLTTALLLLGQARVLAAAAPAVSAARGVLMDADTGELLWSRSPDEPGLIASTTKIMTGWLICRAGDLDRTLSVPAEAVGIEGSSLYLRAGERLSRRELLYGLMLQSGNDAATALAIDAAGSEAAFVARMNAAARELGLAHTHFANPHGLDSAENYASPRDLALLSARALENGDFCRVVSTRSVTVGGDRVLTNHNKLLWRCPGCVGVKTGYTRAAGRLLVSAVRRDGRTLICVTVNAPSDWEDHLALLDWGFGQYALRSVAAAGEPLLTAPGGRKLIAAADLRLSLRPGEEPRLVYVPGFASDLLTGEPAGDVFVFLRDRQLGCVPVIWGN